VGAVTGLDERDLRLLRELAYGAIRQRRRLDYELDQYCPQGIGSLSHAVQSLLRLGAYQLLFADRIPGYAAIGETVELAKHARLGGMADLVNAVLRRVSESGASAVLPDRETEPVRHLGIAYSFPDWLVERLTALFGEQNAETLVRKANEPPPLYVRVNRLRAKAEEVVEILAKEAVGAVLDPIIPHCLRLESRGPLAGLRAFREGLIQVQDRSAQLVAPILDPRPGDVVLDACSAPGGKTTHLAELMRDQGRILALDRDPARLRKVRENAERLGLSCIETRVADAAGDLSFLPKNLDRILVDAPCSGLGTLGRRPDLRWRLTPESSPDLSRRQAKILDNVSRHLKDEGILLYSTCTIMPEENQQVILEFLQRSSSFVTDSVADLIPPEAGAMVDGRGCLETLPFRDDMDGSFAARLTKRLKNLGAKP